MRRFIGSCIAILVLALPLSAGAVGDYTGLTTVEKWIYEEVTKDSSFNYPQWTVTYDSVPYDSVAISSFFTLDGKEAYERYSYKYHADGSTTETKDTLYETGNEMWLKFWIYTVDTAFRAYLTPLNVGDFWAMEIGGMYTGDYDNDGTEDTIIVSHDTTYVLSYGSFTVPAGTYDAFELYRVGRVELRMSSQPPTIEWAFDHERFVPEVGIIYDSTVVVDSVGGFETHWRFVTNKLLGVVNVHENSLHQNVVVDKVVITDVSEVNIENVLMGNLYGVDGTLIDRNITEHVTLPRKGIYILKGIDKDHKSVSVKIIYR